MNCRRVQISLMMGLPMMACVSPKSSDPKNSSASAAESSVASWMFFPPTVTAKISGLRRLPWQVSHGVMAMYSSRRSRVRSLSLSSCLRMISAKTPGQRVNQ